jgi:predicted ester cyclase
VGTHKGDFHSLAPTGRSVKFTAMYFYRFDGGKVVEIYAMVNLLKILQELGAVPSLKQVKN